MGMFDDVDYECQCPVCGHTLNEFQSKSGECLLQLLHPSEVVNFYDYCDKCGAMTDFTAREMRITKFTREVYHRDDGLMHELSKDVVIGGVEDD